MPFLRSFLLTRRFFLVLLVLITGLVVAFFLPGWLVPLQLLLGLLALLTALDAGLLYATGGSVFGRRGAGR